MVSVSRNCKLTNELAIAISEKLNIEEFRKFQEWMKIIEDEKQLQSNKVKRFGHF